MALGSEKWSVIANRLIYQEVIVVKKYLRVCENISDKKKKVTINAETINIIGYKIIGYFKWFFGVSLLTKTMVLQIRYR